MTTEKGLFVVLYPYKVTDFTCGLLELDYFKRYCDVLVLDVSLLTSPVFYKGISAETSRRSEVILVQTWRELIRRMFELRRNSADTNICVLNTVAFNSAAEFFCNLVMTIGLHGRRIAVFDRYISGTPASQPGTVSMREAPARFAVLMDQARRFATHTTTFSEARKKLSAAVFRSLARLMPSVMTHRLVAGDDWEVLARTAGRGGSQVRLVKGHSHDYSNNLLFERTLTAVAPQAGKTAVLLDAAGPMFGDDYIYMGRRVYVTSEVWYPALTRFFDRLELETGVKVHIAGHYKSTHPAIAPCFGNRSVHYGKTRELVRNSAFVMTRQSAALSYAVMFRKPVIFLYSNQIKQDLRAMRGIRHVAAMLGTAPVNIDEPLPNLQDVLKIDEEHYRDYEKACLTSDPSRRPNAQIILEEIMNIRTGLAE